MKKKLGFEGAIVRYILSVWERSGLRIAKKFYIKNAKTIWMGASIVLITMVFANSLKASKYSYASIDDTPLAIEKAIMMGDYALAQKLYETCNQEECLALYERAYPTETTLKKIESIESKLTEYPGNLDIYTMLEAMYRQVGNMTLADYYLSQIKLLDPGR